MTNQVLPAFLSVWHNQYLYAIAFIVISLLLLLPRSSDKTAIIKNCLIFSSTALICAVASFIGYLLNLSLAARILNEIAVILIGILTIRMVGLSLFRVLLPKLSIKPPRILEDIMLVLAYIAWGMVRMSEAGVNLSGLITTSAVITGIIAFSMQDTLGNILGGLALQLDKSINIGDWIETDTVRGKVIEVHWRHTAVRTRNGEVIVVPNSMLMKAKVTIVGGEQVPQWRRWVYFSLSNTIPPQRVINSVDKALHQTEIPLVSQIPRPQCVLMDFKDGLCVYAVRYWLTDAQIDDPTDGTMRVHIFAALQRHGLSLAAPTFAINMTDSLERENRLHDVELASREKTLAQMDLFAMLSDEERTYLAKTLTYAPFAKGDIITRQGDIAHWLYVLIAGEVDIWYEVNEHDRKLLTTLNSGRVFGEMGLMTGEPRRATVIAKTDVECYRIDKQSFEFIIHSRPALADEFARILTERNEQLVAVKQAEAPNHDRQQHERLLDSIKRFFRLS
ncbi:MAG: mechanosensitive ion channel [Moraxellaceae bacterium]|nr:mechanosensitive ion channel [Pseudomonadales bacterium]MCP5174258.1 mechanosensitive ion channel [Moraxellaceae bacterium]MCP5176688.1 mechanosensitive ion channel [Moraxellaceae bacterium]HQV21661.1 mechanosensitive ion channel family protein [Agitococcus sp.]